MAHQSDLELLSQLQAIDNDRLVIHEGAEADIPYYQFQETEKYRDSLIWELMDRLIRGLRFGHNQDRADWIYEQVFHYL